MRFSALKKAALASAVAATGIACSPQAPLSENRK